MLSAYNNNIMPNTNSLSKYSLHNQTTSSPPPHQQQQQQQQQQQPHPSIVHHQQPHSSVTLPSIHSLNIPAFPHTEEDTKSSQPLNHDYRSTAFQQYSTTNNANSTSNTANNNYSSSCSSTTSITNSPTLLIPNSESIVNNNNTILLSPIGSPFNNDAPNRVRSFSDPYQIKQEVHSPNTPPFNDNSTDDHNLSQSPTQGKKNWKPRKKRQCPDCKLFFSNLATHKSTHLKPTNRPHICKYCQRGFARPNDLFRHVKCHWKEIGIDNQFRCPFKSIPSEDNSENNQNESTNGPDHCCHNTGIFSRCDTFKNHLKAIHFQYPNGTKKDQRLKVPGKCRICQANFKNVDDWMHNHIENNSCPYAINLMKK